MSIAELTVSTGFRDVTVDVSLPHTSSTVDLQIFVAGTIDNDLTKRYTGVVPRDIGTLSLTVSEQQASYVVTVKISPSGKNDFQVLCSYTVNGQDGTATLREWHDYVDPAVTTTSKRPSRTNPTEPTQPTDPGHPDEGHGR